MASKFPDLKELETFYAVASALSFSKGAITLGISQSSVSIRIRNLETRYNQKLFYRNGWSVELTPKGEFLYGSVKKLFEHLREIENFLGGQDNIRKIRISAGESTFLSMFPGIITEYRMAHPDIDFNIDINETLKSLENLKVGIVDLIFIGWISEGMYDRNVFEVKALGEDELVLIVPWDHPLADSQSVKPEQIVRYDYIARRKSSGVQRAVMDMLYNAGLSDNDLKVKGVMDNASSVIMAVHKNMGISIVSRMQTTVAASMNLVKVLNINSPHSRRKVYVSYTNRDDRDVVDFAQFAADYFRRHSLPETSVA